MGSHQLHISQINLQHGKASTSLLGRELSKLHTSLALVQEPYVYKKRVRLLNLQHHNVFHKGGVENPRACIVVSKTIEAMKIEELCSRDCVAVTIKMNLDVGVRDWVVASVYLPHDSDIHPTLDMVNLVNWAERKKMPLIVGSDANSHHTAWGSSDVNDRGTELLNFILTSQLLVLNRGGSPTFVTSRRREVLDITLCSQDIDSRIMNWRVSDEASLSDHRYIKFEIRVTKLPSRMIRKPKLTNWSAFCRYLKADGRLSFGEPKTEPELENAVSCLTGALVGSYQRACPLRKVKRGFRAPWWSTRLQELRRITRKHLRRALSTNCEGNWSLFRETQATYKREIRHSKTAAWKNFTETVETVPEMSRVKKILTREGVETLGSLQKPDGSYTGGLEESLRFLLATHFPGDGRTHVVEPRLPSVDEWDSQWRCANRLVSRNCLDWAVSTFKPFKSPGVDEIFPALLQKSIGIIREPLLKVFRSSIALSYIPERWRTTKVVFIPKPGRDSYAQAKSFRPICLTSFLLKTLERIIDRHIRDGPLVKWPLHENQHAYRAGKSTLSALHSLTCVVEKFITRGEYVVGSFFDIEGAFSNVAFDSIDAALETHHVSNTLRMWISKMLRSIRVVAQVGDNVCCVDVSRGCPQGGVLSPLLWALVVNGLLVKLGSKATHSQFYADDGTILFAGHCLATLFELTKGLLRLVDGWCKENGLGINPAKTELVIFTKKRLDLEVAPRLTLNGVVVHPVEQVKYLGVILDQKLSWKAHVDFRIKKASRMFFSCRAAMGRSWGLSPKVMSWIFTAVIRPALLYGVVVWWKRLELRTCQRSLAKLQRMATLAITGAWSTTPGAALEVICGLSPLDLVGKKLALESCYRLKAQGQWGSRLSAPGQLGLETLLRKDAPSSKFPSDMKKPRFRFAKPYRVYIPDRSEWPYLAAHLEQMGIVCYTDGSVQERGLTGAGWHCVTPPLISEEKLPTGKYATVFQTEVVAILDCARWLSERVLTRPVFICSDSQAALQAIGSVRVTSALVLEAQAALSGLAARTSVSLYWVPGHTDVKGNETADSLAREAAILRPCGPEPVLPVNLSVVKLELARWLLKGAWSVWLGSECRQSHEFIEGPGSVNSGFLRAGKRVQNRRIVALLTGHGPFKKHLSVMKMALDSSCRFCQLMDEDAAHLLCFCGALTRIRFEVFHKTTLMRDEIPRIKIEDISKFASLLGEL